MNENPEGLPLDFFTEVMNSITPEYIAMYPEFLPVINKLSKYIECDPNQLWITNGSDDAIRLLFEVFGEPGKKVVSVYPSFEMYSVYTQMYGMVHSAVNYNGEFEVNLSAFLSAIDENTGIVVVFNPNSPIGRPWEENEVKSILEKAKENNAIVVIDEAYHYFLPSTFLPLIEGYDHVIVMRTFSKLLSIAGTRIGYVVSNPEIISMLKKGRSTYPVNSFAIKFAEKLIENSNIIEELVYKEKHGRGFLLDKLNENNYTYHYNNGNYVLIKTKNNPIQVYEKLKAENILIKTYNHPVLSNWIRVTTGSRDIMSTFWKVFEKADE
ncbi:pyridoxal phosphate-dependent aminotransferase [Bacillus sinesaloumensis]|uniref:pyridoxal phosphate-dependent aminotransferase n=1 Tax=Litchfieldia sinesaloumensis TaxID=1926280 RepID=UPI001356344C|nr:histidinol-phosphate transaminase [Bacillus sinesaloumensis]